MTQARIIWALICAIVIAVASSWFVADYASLRRAAAQNDQRGSVLDAATGITHDSDATEARAAVVDFNITDGRTAYQSQLEEARTNDKAIADRTTSIRSDKLRELARERRRARERSGRVAEFGEEGREANAAAER